MDLDRCEAFGRPRSRRVIVRDAARLAVGGALALTAGRLGETDAWAQAATPTTGAYPTSTFIASEYQFTGPTQLSAGLNRLTLANHGQMGHHGLLLKFKAGKGVVDLLPLFKQKGGDLATVADALGGPGGIKPGGTSSAILDLSAGDHALLCVISGADHVPHAAKGMVLPLTVSGAAAATPPPAADLSVQLADFAFKMLPAKVAAGKQTWQIVNQGAQVHELQLLKLAPGASVDQLRALLAAGPGSAASPMAGMATPAPGAATPASGFGRGLVTDAGGLAPMGPGQQAWAELELAAGDYVALCFVRDPASGKPHFALGMLMPFTAG